MNGIHVKDIMDETRQGSVRAKKQKSKMSCNICHIAFSSHFCRSLHDGFHRKNASKSVSTDFHCVSCKKSFINISNFVLHRKFHDSKTYNSSATETRNHRSTDVDQKLKSRPLQYPVRTVVNLPFNARKKAKSRLRGTTIPSHETGSGTGPGQNVKTSLQGQGVNTSAPKVKYYWPAESDKFLPSFINPHFGDEDTLEIKSAAVPAEPDYNTTLQSQLFSLYNLEQENALNLDEPRLGQPPSSSEENNTEENSNEHPSVQDLHVGNRVKTQTIKAKSTGRKFDPNVKRPFPCSVCNKPFRTRTALKIHLRSHSGEKPFACSLCGKAFITAYKLKLHQITHTGEQRFACGVCGQRFANMSHVKDHLWKHTGMKPHTCDLCGKQFSFYSNLSKHKKSVHKDGQVTAFKCEFCLTEFLTFDELREHKTVHVNEERPYECRPCGKNFHSHDNLRKHTRMVHNCQRPHSCDMCGKTFRILSHLRRHENTHTGKKPHPCPMCHKSYQDLHSLNQHLTTHGAKEFKCETCGKEFHLLHYLKRHQMRHAEERSFECQLCKKAFVCVQDLHRHQKIHSEDRKFGCELCYGKFLRACDLRRHMKVHQNETVTLEVEIEEGSSKEDDGENLKQSQKFFDVENSGDLQTFDASKATDYEETETTSVSDHLMELKSVTN